MKKVFYLLAVGTFLTSCGAGISDDQEKASKDLCECMNKEGDFDIVYYECDLEMNEKYDSEVFASEGYSLALEKNCPDIYAKMSGN